MEFWACYSLHFAALFSGVKAQSFITISPWWGRMAAREIVMGPNVRTYLFHSLGGVIGPSFSVARVKQPGDGWSFWQRLAGFRFHCHSFLWEMASVTPLAETDQLRVLSSGQKSSNLIRGKVGGWGYKNILLKTSVLLATTKTLILHGFWKHILLDQKRSLTVKWFPS